MPCAGLVVVVLSFFPTFGTVRQTANMDCYNWYLEQPDIKFFSQVLSGCCQKLEVFNRSIVHSLWIEKMPIFPVLIFSSFQSLGQKGQNKGGSPSISITPLPGRNNPGQKNKGASPSSSTPTIKPGQPGAGQGGKGNFVICEICDGYIKDLEQLRNHMQWIHKVHI